MGWVLKVNDEKRKENWKAENDGKTVRKISGLEKDEMNNDGLYVCSQYTKLIGPMRQAWQWGKKSQAWVGMSIQLLCNGILLLFYSLLFWIKILIKFNIICCWGSENTYQCITLSTYGITRKVWSTRHNFVQQDGQLITRF